ncbi:hypothetical protein Tco_1320765 [Tanacetum coccineum]
MVEPEKPLKKKDQIALDEELALILHAEEQAEMERMQKERVAQEEASRAAIIKELDSIQAMIKADEQLSARLQAEEQEQFSIEEKSRMLVEMIAERKKFFAAQRAAEQRSKLPTKLGLGGMKFPVLLRFLDEFSNFSKIRNRMCTYLKNMGGYKHNQLKGRSYEEIQKLFDKAYKHVNSFVPMDSEVVKTEDRWHVEADKDDDHVEAEKDDDQEEAEIKSHIEIVKDDEVAIDAIPLATKPPMIGRIVGIKRLQDILRVTAAQGPTQSWLMTLTSSADKPSKNFDELISTPIDFSTYIMNGLKITNLTQESLLGPAFKLLKGTRTNFAELEYDFKECYKALQQRNTFYGYARGLESSHDAYSTKRIMAVTQVEVMMKYRYGYLREIEVRRFDNDLYTFKEGDFLRLHINDIEDMLILIVQNRLTNFSGDDVSDFAIALLMRSNELYKFSDGTLTRLRTLLVDITKNIRMEYLPQRRWSSLEKKRAHIMIKAIDKQLKERKMMRSLEKFVGGRHYGIDL